MPDVVPATRLAAALLGVTGLTAVAVHGVAADEAREVLGFTFDGVPPRLSESVDIFANNVGVLGAVLAACGTAQIAHHAAPAGWERGLFRAMTLICDAALITGCAMNVLLIGTAFGAYGRRTLEGALAHGPFELAAFSLVLALYWAGRRERLGAWRVTIVALASVLALAIGALLEVFV